ncbi:RNA polymerase sigma-70 factor [Fulvivirga ulvae]|uniref:RNA polymerase sigma factor n=1 Tax=Fulvivirga ulvae TaxID=2904245 RepID=UPI001F21FF3F|nr:RNA polymerase sigma-70 factor [Fulvivirga ulvae]UII29741.1 RNA polymerase sigma-70 factor [Fulvivirga ulvae]
MTREDELILFKKVRNGDKRALDMLFRSYYNTLCNFSYSIVKNTDLVEELVADIFYILWRDCKHLDIKRNLRAYLFTAVRNKSLEVIRKEQKSAGLHEELGSMYLSTETPETSLLYNELNQHYQKAYEALPEKCRQVFKLHKIDGLSYQEISDILNISIKTVENQMGKALKLIRADIAHYQLRSLPKG